MKPAILNGIFAIFFDQSLTEKTYIGFTSQGSFGMKKSFVFTMSLVSGLLVMSHAYAQSAFENHVTECVSKFANANDAATVMLECTAGGGKLSDCKVVENTTPNKGFEKAAVCVASALPVGSKTGAIRVPIRFAGA